MKKNKTPKVVNNSIRKRKKDTLLTSFNQLKKSYPKEHSNQTSKMLQKSASQNREDTKLRMAELQAKRTDGTWVKCSKPVCGKILFKIRGCMVINLFSP